MESYDWVKECALLLQALSAAQPALEPDGRERRARGLTAMRLASQMNLSRAASTVLLLIVTGCGSSAPVRPGSVPETGVWAGGPDGGAWIDCRPVTKEPYLEYDCTTYLEMGAVWRSGQFIIAWRNGELWDLPSGPTVPARIDRYMWFDGTVIMVAEDTVLIPRDLVDRGGHEKREQVRLEEIDDADSG